MAMNQILLFFLLVGSGSVLVSATEYYVQPDGSPCPPNTTCHDLFFYTNQSAQYFTTNATFYFLEGTHILDGLLVIAEVSNLTLIGLGYTSQGYHKTAMQSSVMITCRSLEGGIAFVNSATINLIGLTITQCSSYPIYSSNLIIFDYFEYLISIGSALEETGIYKTSVSFFEVAGVLISNFSIQNTTNYGLLAINMFSSTITSSSFAVNNFDTSIECVQNSNITCGGGNALFGYTNSWFECFGQNHTFNLIIEYSNFTNGFKFDDRTIFTGGGVSIFMEQTVDYEVSVFTDNFIAYDNGAIIGGNINFIVTDKTPFFQLFMNSTKSSYGNRLLLTRGLENEPWLTHGGGLYIFIGTSGSQILEMQCGPTDLTSQIYPVFISQSSFTNNYALSGGGVYLSVSSLPLSPHLQTILFQLSNISGNHGYVGIGLFVEQVSFTTFGSALEFFLNDISIMQSKLRFPSILNLAGTGTTINLQALNRVRISNIRVLDNTPNQGASVSSSALVVSGTGNVFRNNSALSGGAISLSDSSFIILVSPAIIKFINNFAMYQGGAVYINENPTLSPLCFFQIQSNSTDLNPIADWIFINNTANLSGDAVYGGNLLECGLLKLSAVASSNCSEQIFNNTFKFFNRLSNSVVSSNSFRVCFCQHNAPSCYMQSMNFSIFPGQSVNLMLATVGNFNGISEGIVEIKQFANTSSQSFSSGLLSTQSQCFNYSYVVKTAQAGQLLLSISVQPDAIVVDSLRTFPSIRSYVTVLECPTGFELSSTSSECVCSDVLAQRISNISCNISTELISRKGNVWIGYHNSSECLLIDADCPFDYCKQSLVTFSIFEPNSQCALNRSGILCGECAEGLSLMLGSNRCGECENTFLSLITIFAFAGIALVAFLITLNLTVSVGTINGLIFYANVIKINESIFFPNGPVPFLSQFISWLNLDLGIQTCFYNGLNSYQKSWLQFIFPVYIWILIIIVIIICRYSTRFTRLVGRNAFPVFATLILLSYTKLFRLVVPILQFVQVYCTSQNSSERNILFWAVDANLSYTSTSHIVLVVFALLVLVLIAVPYTGVLIFQPLLLTKIKYNRCQRYCLDVKPLFDAYYGPYVPDFRIWTGLLLCARLLLVVVASFGSKEAYTSVVISIVVLLLAAMSIFKTVYKRKLLNAIECWFLLNIGILSSVVKELPYATIVDVSLACLSFFGIIIYHIYGRYIQCFGRRCLCCKPKTDGDIEGSLMSSFVENGSTAILISRANVKTTVVEGIMRRESLILDSEESGDTAYSPFDDK